MNCARWAPVRPGYRGPGGGGSLMLRGARSGVGRVAGRRVTVVTEGEPGLCQ